MGKINNCCIHVCYMVWVVNITERSGRDLSDYQVRVEVTDPDFFNKCTDQKYVEFYDSDKTTLLPHYTEIFDVANKRAVFWVKVPSIPANGTKTIYLNVNTERTEDLSNGEAVFDFFDDFSSDSLDTSKWNVNSNGYAVENGYIKLFGDWNGNNWYISTISKFTSPRKIIGKWRLGKINEDTDIYVILGSAQNSVFHKSGYGLIYDGQGGDVYGHKRIEKGSDIIKDCGKVTDTEWHKFEIIFKSNEIRFWDDLLGECSVSGEGLNEFYLGIGADTDSSSRFGYIDYIAIAKHTDPEPSVIVAKAGATATLDFKRIVAKALAGKISHILNGDPRIKLYNGGTLIKEITAGARLRKEDTANKRFIVMFLFVDDSNDAYTTDSQELVFPHSDGDYVAFTQSESFEKVADEPLPLRWEIYVPWVVDEEGWGEVWP